MCTSLYNQLSSGTLNGRSVFQQWRQLWSESKDIGILSLLQLCVDMTGFVYNLELEDLILLQENIRVLLENKILKAPHVLRNFPRDGTFISYLDDFLKNLMVRPWQELLTDNEWLNMIVKLIFALCTSTHDECVMAGASFGSTMLLCLCSARDKLNHDLERLNLLRDRQQLNLLEKKRRYLDSIFTTMCSYVAAGFKYAEISCLLTERFCEMLVSFPCLIVIEYKCLDLITDILKHKNRKSVHAVLRCLKSISSETCDHTVTREVCYYILTHENALVRIMDTFKSFELGVLQLLLHACRITENKVDDETAQRISIRMFSNDAATIDTAIDSLSLYYTEDSQVTNVERNTILAVVHTFGRYEYPLQTLETIAERLWERAFFQEFDDLFQLLLDATNEVDYSFGAKSLVHMITRCHQQLMDDIKNKISPSHHGSESVTWSLIRTRIESFVHCYPKCLGEVSEHPDVFNLLLNCLSPDDKELYSVAGVNCELYYVEVLYNILSPIALNAKEYPLLSRTLSTIYRFDTIIHISEDIWKELTENYFTLFFHTRSRLRRYNLAVDKQLMEAYSTAITRLCVLLEINNTSEHVFALADYLANDLRLLDRMALSDEANAIFYRLYKNTLYARVHHMLQHPSGRHQHGKNPQHQFGKQVRAFMTELVAQVGGNAEQPIDVGRHVVVALCDMLVLSQPGEQNTALQQIAFPVEQDVLENLTKYVERNVFIGGSDIDTMLLSARKVMLVTYNKLYSLHSGLPRLTDTRHVLKHYGTNITFAEELEQLLNILYSKSPEDFFDTVTQVTFDFCQKKKCYYKMKAFLQNIQTFHSKYLDRIVESDHYCLSIIRRIVGTILDQHLAAEDITKTMVLKLLSIAKSWAQELSSGCRMELHIIIANDPNYSEHVDDSNADIYKMVKQFQRSLKKHLK